MKLNSDILKAKLQTELGKVLAISFFYGPSLELQGGAALLNVFLMFISEDRRKMIVKQCITGSFQQNLYNNIRKAIKLNNTIPIPI